MSEPSEKKQRRRMPKWAKATLITLGSLLGLLVVAVAVVCWLVFTPSKLTGIVNKVAADVVTCDMKFERVSLTLFKTFPFAGLDVHNVTLVNPTPGAPNDTVACIDDLVLAINAKQFIARGDVIVKQLLLDGVKANLYVSEDGTANFDVLKPSDDTTESKPLNLPDYIDIEKVKLNRIDGCYNDYRHGLFADVSDLALNVKGFLLDSKADIDAELKSKALSLVTADSMQNEKFTVSLADLKLKAAGRLRDSNSADAKLKLNLADIALHTCDTAGDEVVSASFDKLGLQADAEGWLNDMNGTLKLSVPKGDVSLNGMNYVTDALKAQKDDLLSVELPFNANVDDMTLKLTDAEVTLAQWAVGLAGEVALPKS